MLRLAVIALCATLAAGVSAAHAASSVNTAALFERVAPPKNLQLAPKHAVQAVVNARAMLVVMCEANRMLSEEEFFETQFRPALAREKSYRLLAKCPVGVETKKLLADMLSNAWVLHDLFFGHPLRWRPDYGVR